MAFYGIPGTCEDLSAATVDGSIRITCEGIDVEDTSDATIPPTSESTTAPETTPDVQGPSGTIPPTSESTTTPDVQGPSGTITPTTEATTTPETTTTTATETTDGTTECEDSSICVSEVDCKNEALAMGLELGGTYVFAGPWDIKGCHYYPQDHPLYGGQAYFGTGGTSCAQLSETPWDGSVRIGCGSMGGDGAPVTEDIPTDLQQEPAPPAAAPTIDVVSTVAPTGTSSSVVSPPVQNVVNTTDASNLTTSPATDLPLISTANPTDAPSATRTAVPSPTQTPTTMPTNATTSPTTPPQIPMVNDVPQTPMVNATSLATDVPTTIAATDATNPPSSVLNAPTMPPTITPANVTAVDAAPPQAAEEVAAAPSQAPGAQDDLLADNQVVGKDDKQQDQQKDDKNQDSMNVADEESVAAGPGDAVAGGDPGAAGFANNNGTEPFFAEGPGQESNGVIDVYGDAVIAAVKSSATLVPASRHVAACALATAMAMCCFM